MPRSYLISISSIVSETGHTSMWGFTICFSLCVNCLSPLTPYQEKSGGWPYIFISSLYILKQYISLCYVCHFFTLRELSNCEVDVILCLVGWGEVEPRWLMDSRVIFFFPEGKRKPVIWHLHSGLLCSQERKGWAEKTAHCQGHSGGFFAEVGGTELRLGSSLWSHGFPGPLFSPTHSMAMRETAKYSN